MVRHGTMGGDMLGAVAGFRGWPRAARVAVYAAAGLVLLLVAGLLAVVYLVRMPLPQTTGSVDVPGLSAPVDVVRDEHGCERRFVREWNRGFTSWWGDKTYPDDLLTAWEVPAFSRRARQVRVRLEYRDAGGPWASAAELVVPNPAPGPYPQWSAPSLPVTARDGALPGCSTNNRSEPP